jgi:hypothetical protein
MMELTMDLMISTYIRNNELLSNAEPCRSMKGRQIEWVVQRSTWPSSVNRKLT